MLGSLLEQIALQKASDLHLYPGKEPTMRHDGRLVSMREQVLTVEEMEGILKGALTSNQYERYKKTRDLDMAITHNGVRYRANWFSVRGEKPSGVPAAVFRRIDTEIPTLESLHLPSSLQAIAEKPRGLVLVTGPAGSGKSTTLAAMVRHLNDNYSKNIITIEDPVEYIHLSHRSLIRQREIGLDTVSFARALKSCLRQDPDVILVGEMRDTETIELALTAAETGHLVLATLHTRTAPGAVERVIDAFEAGKQAQVRVQLAGALEAVVSQTLVPRVHGGRVAAMEIMTGTTAVRALIRDDKTHQLGNAIVTGSREGMMTIEASLAQLVREGLISLESARAHARDLDSFARQMGSSSTPDSVRSRGGGKMR
jgi:twitching motility protein PilT